MTKAKRAQEEASAFPKVYRLEGSERTWAVGLMLGFVALTLLSALAFWSLAFLPFAAIMLAALWVWVSAKTTLWPDRVEAFNGLTTRTIRGPDVRAYRRHGNLHLVRLIPRDAKVRPFWASSKILSEKGRIAWIAALADADQEEKEALRRALDSDPRFGATHVERRMFFARMRRWSRVATALGLLIAAWIVFWPEPYALAMAAGCLAPAAAIALNVWSRGLLRIFGAEDARPGLVWVMAPPAVAAWSRAMDVRLIENGPAVGAALLGGLALAVVMAAADERLRQRVGVMLLAGVALAFYVYAAAVFANVLPDAGREAAFRPAVMAKTVDGGRQKTHRLKLAPWGPHGEPQSVIVDRRLYERVAAGGAVCISLHPGALGWPWYEVAACDAKRQ